MSGDSARSIDTARVQAVADALQKLAGQQASLAGLAPCRAPASKLPAEALSHLVARIESIAPFANSVANQLMFIAMDLSAHVRDVHVRDFLHESG